MFLFWVYDYSLCCADNLYAMPDELLGLEVLGCCGHTKLNHPLNPTVGTTVSEPKGAVCLWHLLLYVCSRPIIFKVALQLYSCDVLTKVLDINDTPEFLTN